MFSRNSKSLIIALGFTLSVFFAAAQNGKKEWKIVDLPGKKQIDILFDGKLITSYCYYDSVFKPILFPINTISGVTVTRGYPIRPVMGETADHPHHTGLWMNYESVNGIDFWNHSSATPVADLPKRGSIRHKRLISSKASAKRAELVTQESWIMPDGQTIMDEETRYVFSCNANELLIDRFTKLTAQEKEVSFKDTKDGFIAIRVARELEMPSSEEREFVDSHGKVIRKMDNGEGVTGMYLNSEGVTGNAAWGARARWCTLSGKKDGQEISISIIDHAKNAGYPTYWHARGYGLFAANPLGQEIFSKGKEKLNFTLQPNQSTIFRYRIVITSGKGSAINLLADDFAKTF